MHQRRASRSESRGY